MKSRKGGSFERELCVAFSKWWTQNKRTDVFWRTAGSGARATTRAKTGQTTYGSHGDIMAVDPIGTPLLRLFTIEIKRGYSKHTLHDILDDTTSRALPTIQGWINKTNKSIGKAGSHWWMVVHRRDRREAMVYLPNRAGQTLFDEGPTPYASIRYKYRTVFVTTLKEFFRLVQPDTIRRYLDDLD